MKKIILILLCLIIFFVAISCQKMNSEEIQRQDAPQNIQDYENTSSLDGFMSTNEYKTIIDMYKEIVDIHKIYTPTEAYEKYNDNFSQKWYREIFSATLIGHVSNNSYGYAFSDLNSDDKSELILLLEDYTIIAIFSMVDGTPMLLDTFSANNHYVALDQDGILYQTGYGKGENSYTKIMQLSDSGNFETLLEFGCCDNGADFEYYVIENSVKRIVDLQSITRFQQQYATFLQNPSNTNKNSGILYIPVM